MEARKKIKNSKEIKNLLYNIERFSKHFKRCFINAKLFLFGWNELLSYHEMVSMGLNLLR